MLYNKHRLSKLSQFLGNDEIIESVKESIKGEVNTYLLHGKKGCGKTTLARIIANELGVDNLDLHEIDAADQTGIEHARKLKRTVGTSPNLGEHKAYIIDECHRLSEPAQDSLLKTLEEPPDFVFFILCTTRPNKVAGTIKSRAVRYNMNPLKKKDMALLLKRIIKKEKKNFKIDKDIVSVIIENAEGIPRDAITMMEQVKNMKFKKAVKLLQQIPDEDAQINLLCQNLLQKGDKKWQRCLPIIKEIKEKDSETTRRGILNYFNKVLLSNSKNYKYILKLMECFLDNTYDTGQAGLMYSIGLACLV